jgi:hypothetical protein
MLALNSELCTSTADCRYRDSLRSSRLLERHRRFLRSRVTRTPRIVRSTFESRSSATHSKLIDLRKHVQLLRYCDSAAFESDNEPHNRVMWTVAPECQCDTK